MMKRNHIKTVLLLIVYFVVTQSSFFVGIINSVPYVIAFLLNIFFSIFFGVTFLYIFDHEDFFGVASEIQRNNIKREKKWLHRFKNFGKSSIVLLMGVLLGPLFGAITLRLLLPKYKYKYPLMIFVATTSAILWLGIARGIISFTLPFFT